MHPLFLLKFLLGIFQLLLRDRLTGFFLLVGFLCNDHLFVYMAAVDGMGGYKYVVRKEDDDDSGDGGNDRRCQSDKRVY